MDALPEELIVYIRSYVSDADAENLRQTCSTFYDIFYSEYIDAKNRIYRVDINKLHRYGGSIAVKIIKCVELLKDMIDKYDHIGYDLLTKIEAFLSKPLTSMDARSVWTTIALANIDSSRAELYHLWLEKTKFTEMSLEDIEYLCSILKINHRYTSTKDELLSNIIWKMLTDKEISMICRVRKRKRTKRLYNTLPSRTELEMVCSRRKISTIGCVTDLIERLRRKQ